MKHARISAAAVLMAGILPLGGCATLVQSLVAGLAAESACRSSDTGNDGRAYYDEACLDSIDQWQDENPM
ncbi:hypothetical protein [Hyphomonas sp.]|uniref:hypothetical protein n=1 Tax=Hyphomonas sp. TaxID=87 RepID=UPI0025BDDFFD|nr:hypothetical protein [Hyphomonas sp.]